jgi:hypothetical protein
METSTRAARSASSAPIKRERRSSDSVFAMRLASSSSPYGESQPSRVGEVPRIGWLGKRSSTVYSSPVSRRTAPVPLGKDYISGDRPICHVIAGTRTASIVTECGIWSM